MWSPRLAAAIVAVALLGGCGLRPLYGARQGTDMDEILAQVEVAPIPDRVGQQLRNSLLDALTPKGPSRKGPRYRLHVILNEGISNLAVQKDAFTTRANLRLDATFSLRDQTLGKSVFSSTSQSTSSFNILGSEFATVIAERSARARAVKGLSEEIRTQVAVFLRQNRDVDERRP